MINALFVFITDLEVRGVFSRSRLSHFLFLWIGSFFTLNEEHFTFHLRYKYSGMFANHKYVKYEEPSYPHNLKMRHYSRNSIENVTPL